MPGPKGSPRRAMGANLLIVNLDLTIEEAMWQAKYNQKVAQGKQQKKNVSKKKNHILAASGKENFPTVVKIFLSQEHDWDLCSHFNINGEQH